MNVPRVSIVLPFEGTPRVLTDARNDDEATRLADWICSQPDLIALIDAALLSGEARRAEDES